MYSQRTFFIGDLKTKYFEQKYYDRVKSILEIPYFHEMQQNPLTNFYLQSAGPFDQLAAYMFYTDGFTFKCFAICIDQPCFHILARQINIKNILFGIVDLANDNYHANL